MDAETENQILSIGREFLSPEARKVLDREELTEEEALRYRSWLESQAESMGAE